MFSPQVSHRFHFSPLCYYCHCCVSTGGKKSQRVGLRVQRHPSHPWTVSFAMTSTCSRLSDGAAASFRRLLSSARHRRSFTGWRSHGPGAGGRDFPAGAPCTGPGVKVRALLQDGDISQVFTSGLQGEGRRGRTGVGKTNRRAVKQLTVSGF